MTRLTILRGVSGSGKSTWARQQNAVVVSRDTIRHETLGIPAEDYYKVDAKVLADRESLVTRLQNAMISAVLKAGKDVIVDNTNTEWKFVTAIAKIGYRHGAEVNIKLFDVDVKTAIERDQARKNAGGRFVGADIIQKQHSRLQGTKHRELDPVQAPKPYNGTPGKPKAFLVDIDGTLAHMRDYRGPFDWSKVGLDDVDEIISEVVFSLWNDGLTQWQVVVMSGRDESCRELTEAWLKENLIPYDHLFMRPEKDMRPDNIVKAELFDNYVRDNFDVRFVLDDRDQVVDMWRSMGITCLQVAPGDF